jgi:hypothetical protein
MDVEKVTNNFSRFFLRPELLTQSGRRQARKDTPMDKFLGQPVRTFAVYGLDDQAEGAGESPARKQNKALSASDINLNPVSNPQEMEFLVALVPFHRIPSKMLFKIVRVATGLDVRDRWVAIRAIIAKRIPIPVTEPLADARHTSE